MRAAVRVMTMIGVFVLSLAGASVLAHEVTYKGTVVSATPTSVKVNVVNEKTKKVTLEAFEIDPHTKILRGDVVVTFANARIQKDEQIAVTVNLDDGGECYAEVIRLPVKK